VIPFDGCTPGDEPFIAIECLSEEAEIEVTRRMARGVAATNVAARSIANHAGVAPSDFDAFLAGTATLTHPARARVRGVLG
jgi:hypothetical protein